LYIYTICADVKNDWSHICTPITRLHRHNSASLPPHLSNSKHNEANLFHADLSINQYTYVALTLHLLILVTHEYFCACFSGFMPSVHTAREKEKFVRYVGVPHTQQYGSYFYSPVGKQLHSLRSHTILAVLPTDGLKYRH